MRGLHKKLLESLDYKTDYEVVYFRDICQVLVDHVTPAPFP
jgi:hypothetical protein